MVRHGETNYNYRKISHVNKGVLPNKKGKEEHKKVAKFLKNIKIDVIYSSDYPRTKHLTKEILKFHKVPVKYDIALRERAYGIYEGKPYGLWRIHANEQGISLAKFKLNGGESIDELQIRSEKFYGKIIKKYKDTDNTILLVTHSGIIISLLIYFFKLKIKNTNVDKIKPYYTAVSIISIDKKGNHKAELINSVSHL